MRALAQAPAQFTATALIVSCLALAGCSTTRSQRDSGVARVPESANPALLYLLDAPHPRIHVEVDAVEGSVPNEVTLQKLRDFLSAHCNKPGGIEIVRGDVIPIEAARGISPTTMARKYINGPDRTTNSQSAFLYVLYYNYPLSRDSGVTRALHRGASIVPTRRPQNANPYAEVYPYPAIYFNAHFSLGLGMNEILLHETGHVFGMVSRSNHARGGHCLNRGCQMNNHLAYLREFRWLPGRRQSPLCAECIAELAQRSAQPPSRNLRYVGAVLVRSEANYHIAHLPDRTGLIVGSLTDRDCHEFVAAMRPETGRADDGWRLHCLVKDNVLKDPAKLNEIFRQIKSDPFNPVRVVGPAVFLEACCVRYRALGQYSNVVNTLEQAIRLEPKDHWTYNQLARIKATCPDRSVRNGNAAVAAASKACELTRWKNWQYIDTLAAACAEAGDFKRAVEFQERALRAGKATKSKENRMREQLSLYKQSEPLREKPPG